MTAMRAFIFGAGYSGRAYGRALVGKGIPVRGTTRSPDKAAALARLGIVPLLFDGALSADLREALAATTHLVVSAAPGEGGDPLFAIAAETIRNSMPRLEWIGYLSTVGVYGDHGGDWVTEDSECRPGQQRTELRIEAENAWLAIGAETNRPVAVLRLSGIYGPGRNALANMAAGTVRRIVKPGQIFNRIHVEDIAGALIHLGERRIGGVFNVSDDEPSPPQDVIAFAAALMGVEAPPEIDFATADLSPMARSFYGETKRVSNARLKATGYEFRFPNYRAALSTMWADGSWRGDAG